MVVTVADIRIAQYEPAHGDYIAANLRPSDKREMYYMAVLTPAAAIKATTASAVRSYTALVDGLPALMWGVSRRSFVSSVGVPWLLGTMVAEDHQYKFGRETLTYFKEMASLFPVMENYALAENKRALRWIKWAGFDIEEPRPYGAFGAEFVRFGRGLECA